MIFKWEALLVYYIGLIINLDQICQICNILLNLNSSTKTHNCKSQNLSNSFHLRL